MDGKFGPRAPPNMARRRLSELLSFRRINPGLTLSDIERRSPLVSIHSFQVHLIFVPFMGNYALF